MERDYKVWLNARELYRDLAIPEFHFRFEDWFTTRIQGEFQINKDWTVDAEKDPPEFRITREVYDKIAYEELGLPITRIGSWSHEQALMGWNEHNNPQKVAITDDEKLLD